MSKPWYDIAASKLDPEDSIQKSYSCSYNKNHGYLCLGSKKLVFVSVKGFLKKSYDVSLNIPYSELEEVSQESRFKLNLKHNGNDHIINSTNVSAKVIKKALQDIIANSPKLSVAFVEA